LNVVLVLKDGSQAYLSRIAPTLEAAWRKDRVDPFVLTVDELPRVAQEFPLKLMDIQRTNCVLVGSDMFEGLKIDEADVRHRLRQELRNLALRLRRRYILAHDDTWELSQALGRLVVPLCVNLETLLALDGKKPGRDDIASVFDRAASEYGLNREVLGALEALRNGRGNADPRKLYAEAVAEVTALAARVETGVDRP